MKKCLSLAVCLTALLVAGCSSDINKGVVISKDHQGMMTQIILFPSGKVMLPQTIILPERWTLNISDSGKTGYCNVSKERFDSVTVGDYIECN